MRPQRQLTKQQEHDIRQALKSVTCEEEEQRVKVVLLRMEQGLTAKEISKILGLHTASIWKIHARFFKEGAVIFKNKPHGGRCHENLSSVRERMLLEPFLKQSKKNTTLAVSNVKAAYENAVGYEVQPSTIYRMLKRHGWQNAITAREEAYDTKIKSQY